MNVISRSLFVVVRFITRNIKLSIKKILLATPQPWREERGETHFPFFVEWAVPRCVVHRSIAGAGSLRARTLHYRNVEGMAAIACKNPSHVCYQQFMFTIHKLSKHRREATRSPCSGLLFSFFELFGISRESFTFFGTKRIGKKLLRSFEENFIVFTTRGSME